jgi:hypothetical protein
MQFDGHYVVQQRQVGLLCIRMNLFVLGTIDRNGKDRDDVGA